MDSTEDTPEVKTNRPEVKPELKPETKPEPAQVRRDAAPRPVMPQATRPSAQQRKLKQTKLMKWMAPLVGAICLIVGLALGVMIDRARHKAGQAVAAINKEVIYQDEFYNLLEKQYGDKVIRTIATDILKQQFAKNRGEAPTQKQIDAKYASIISISAVAQAIERGQIDPAELKRQIEGELIQKAVLTNGIQASDEEIHKYYETNIDPNSPTAKFYTPEIARVAVLITPSKAVIDKADKEINDNTMSWETAVGTYSEDQSKLEGGQLKPILKGRSLKRQSKDLEDAIFSMKVGDRSKPLRFGNNWWLIKLLDKIPPTTQPFDKVMDQCELDVKMSKLSLEERKKISTDFADFAKKSTVQAFWPRYKEALNFN